jgi:pimeloyl-ACP methyl ester carboxylesterase
MPENTQPPVTPWLPDLYQAAGLAPEDPLPRIQAAMDDLALRAAPLARSWSRWMTLIQAAAVLMPMLWLLRRTLKFPPSVAALSALLAVLALVGALWWVRWRGMQRTWARARLVAEVARSQITAAVFPRLPVRRVLESISELQPLLVMRDAAHEQAWPRWRETWLRDRLEDQLAYYRKAKERAEKSRQHFTRWSTIFMDVMLALAVGGVVLTLSDRAPQWLRLFGDYRAEAFLGIVGVMLPLGIILLQSLRYLQELSRRTARFSRQIILLEKARAEITQTDSPEVALEIVSNIEEQLLDEVVDWYFEAETSEQFYQVREMKAHATPVGPVPAGYPGRVAHLAWVVGGVGLLFLGKVLLGRLPYLLAASVGTLAWLSFSSPSDPEARSHLRSEGTLMNDEGKAWVPDPERTVHGTIIIAHGLHDGAIMTATGEESLWMRQMHEALGLRLGDRAPDIALVDWSVAAMPSNIHRLNPGDATAKFLADLAGIPSQAREVGDLLAFRLAQLILEGRIDRSQPLHLIGHSAGGFVVSRAALYLKKMNLAPTQMHVTILDTPAPDHELTVEVPNACSGMDFYVTSPFVLGLDDQAPPPGVYLKHIAPAEGTGMLEAHSYAHKWFTKTVVSAKPGDSGFGRSPFAR